MTKGDKELAWVFGGAAALYAVYFFWPKGQSVVNPPAPVPGVMPSATPNLIPPALQNVSVPGVPPVADIQVAAGQTLSLSAPIGATVIVWPAFGSRWVSQDGAPITAVIQPVAFQMAGPISHSYVWVDVASNTTQTGVVNFTVQPVPPPVVVATT